MSDLISSELDSDMKNSWRTDPRVFKALDDEFNFDLDTCASDDNYLVSNYLTIEHDALTVDWSTRWSLLKSRQNLVKKAFSNPPYSRGMIKKFMAKYVEQKNKGVTTVAVVPATLDAQWLPISEISEIRIITGGRLSFCAPCDYVEKGKGGKPDKLVKAGDLVAGSTKGSMFVIFRPTKSPCFVRLIDRDELLESGAC